jgi:hypothetical protein
MDKNKCPIFNFGQSLPQKMHIWLHNEKLASGGQNYFFNFVTIIFKNIFAKSI